MVLQSIRQKSMSIAGACWSAQNVYAGKGIYRKVKKKKKKERFSNEAAMLTTKIHSLLKTE